MHSATRWILVLFLLFTGLAGTWPPPLAGEERPLPRLPRLPGLATAGPSRGVEVVTIVLRAEDAPRLFPADPELRRKEPVKALVTDGRRAFLGSVSRGGQSSLKAQIPNLRLRDLEECAPPGDGTPLKTSPALAGLPILDGTLRLNPLTMDEGYINTLTYLGLANHFGLLPTPRTPLQARFAKVEYRFVDGKDQWTTIPDPAGGGQIPCLRAGLHLVTFHPVKFLKDCEVDGQPILAVARSRYNIQNLPERARRLLGRTDDDADPVLFRSIDVRSGSVTPFRVEIEWGRKTKAEKAQAEGGQEPASVGRLKETLIRVYAAPKRFRGEDLHRELARAMDLSQWFRFMALNRLLDNGDISDEFFWYLLPDPRGGEGRLGVMAQDGDDLFRGAHFFPTHPRQIGLLLRRGRGAGASG